jgi:hypothetical protein
MSTGVNPDIHRLGRLGASLARLELAEALTVMTQRMPRARRIGPFPPSARPLRAEHAEHIRQLRQDAAERAAALNAALDVARGAALEYQAQLATGRAATAPGAKKTPAKKAAPQRGSRST